MKRTGIIFFTICLFLTTNTFGAENKVIKAGGGSESGVYSTVVLPNINKFSRESGINIDVVPGGTAINLERLKKGELDIAVVQFNGLLDQNDIEIIGFTHRETVHFLVADKQAGGKIDEFSDLNKSHTIAIGNLSGGTAITWSNFVKLDKDLAEVKVSPLSGVRALTALAAGDINAWLYVSGIKNKDMMRANSSPQLYELVEIDIGALDNLMYKGKKVYEFGKVLSSTYPGLIEGKLNFSQKSLEVAAVLVCTGEWASNNERSFEILFDSVSKASPVIAEKLKN